MRSASVPCLLILTVAACGGRTAGSGNEADNDGDHTGGGGLVARILEPNGSSSILSGTTLTLRASFVDGEDAVSPDSVTWTSSVDDTVLGTTNPLPGITLVNGTHTIEVEGALGSDTARDTVTVSVTDFAVAILDPTHERRVEFADNVTFNGEARIQSGALITRLVSGLPGAGERQASYTWSSDKDGAFGTLDDSMSYNALSVGDHVITLTVVDDDAVAGSGRTATASIHLTILPPNTPPNVTITDPASCPIDVEAGTSRAFAGLITDPDAADAGIEGSWSESISGAKGAGASFTFAGSAVLGKHQVTLTAEDSQGAVDDAVCDVYVVPPGQTRATFFPATTALNSDLPNGGDAVRWIGADGSGNTWIGDDQGLAVFDSDLTLADTYDGDDLGTNGGDVRVEDAAITTSAALIATEQGLALCTYGAPALTDCTELEGGDFNAVALAGDPATTAVVAAGADDGLYLATYSGGSPTGEEMLDEDNSNLPDNQVRDVLLDGAVLYVATSDGLCIAEAPAAALASPDALCTTILDDDTSILPSDEIRALAKSGDTLWIGTSDGVATFDTETGAVVVYGREGLSDVTVNDIVVDADGIVWIAHDEGISRFDPDTGGLTTLRGSDWGDPGEDNVRAIFIDAAGQKWFATNAGVVRYTGS